MVMIANAGSQVLLGPTVSASRGSDSVDVEVRGHAVSVVPGLSLPVRATAAGPVERFEPQNERFRISEGSPPSNSRTGRAS